MGLGRDRWVVETWLIVALTLVVATAFVAIKVWHPAAEIYRSTIGIAMWPIGAIGDGIRDHPLAGVQRVSLVEDRSDLIALCVAWVPVWIVSRVRQSVPL